MLIECALVVLVECAKMTNSLVASIASAGAYLFMHSALSITSLLRRVTLPKLQTVASSVINNA